MKHDTVNTEYFKLERELCIFYYSDRKVINHYCLCSVTTSLLVSGSLRLSIHSYFMHHSEALYRGVYAKRRCLLASIGVVVLAREKDGRVGNYLRKIRGSFYEDFCF